MLRSKIVKKIVIKAGVIAIWLLLWQLTAKAADTFFFPAPSAVIYRLCVLIKEPDFLKTTACSLWRIFKGCVLGIAAGTILGALTAFSKALYEFFAPVLTVIKATPVASFIILVLIWLRRDNVPTVMSFIMVVPVLWSNVSGAIFKTDSRLIEMAKVFRFSHIQMLKRVYIPQIMPYFSAGCTTAVGFAWKAGIAAEVLAIPASAIGTQLYYSKINLEYVDLFAWTSVVILLSLLFEKALILSLNKLASGREAPDGN